MSKKRNCKSLSLSEKVKLITEVQNSGKKKKDIAADFGIPANTLSTILKNKDLILNAMEETSFGQNRKRLKTSSYPDVEEGMVKWLKSARDRKLPISGPILREKAEQFAMELGRMDFKASTGWLDRFKNRNGIGHKIMNRVIPITTDVDCDKWRKEIIPQLIKDYDPNDIFSASETSLYCKALPDKVLNIKGENCHDEMGSKDCVTVMVGANMSGMEKLPLLVIGSVCYIGIKSLPVMYETNKNSWMISSFYENWLQKTDRKFHQEKRKVLLFVDSCPAPLKVLTQDLHAIKVVFFPTNITSQFQPMNQGIIKNLKQLYRKGTVLRIIENLSKKKMLSMTMLDCIMELDKAWSVVTSNTIAHCFRKAGFYKEIDSINEFNREDEIMLSQLEWSIFQKITHCEIEFDRYIDVDCDIAVAEYPATTEIIESIKKHDRQNTRGGDDDEDSVVTISPPTVDDACKALEIVRSFIISQPNVNENVFQSLNTLDNFCIFSWRNNMKELKMTEFFNKLKV